MFETFGFETLTAPQAALWFGAALGIAYGLLAEVTGFCLRRALVAGPGRGPAAGVWLMALVVAVLGTQGAMAAGVISFADHRFAAPDLPVLAVLVGGALFGAGMVLARGCAARLSVLAASGNLRAVLGLGVFAVTVHATMKGVLSPLREALTGVTLPLGEAATLSALPGGAALWSAVIVLPALAFVCCSGASRRHLGLAALLGLLVPLGWVGTGFILYDDFDPIALESLSFTAPMADTLFWGIAASAVPARFGTGLIGGVMLGALVASLAGRRFSWQSFATPAQTGRALSGAVLMGVGGVLAGGCTIGAGLSGVPTLGVAALLALVAITLGAIATNRALSASYGGSAGSSSRPPARQAA